MARKINCYIKLQVKAGQANPAPPVGPALGQRGLNIMEFCKAFNAATSKLEPGLPTPVIITAYSDRTFTFVTKSTPASVLLKKAAGVTSGSKRPNTDKVGKVTRKQLEEIVKVKGSRFDGSRSGSGSAHDCGFCPQHGFDGGGLRHGTEQACEGHCGRCRSG